MKTLSLDELIESLNLSHVDVPYDPAKRREYYLRTRQLLGRKTGQALEISGEKSKGSSGIVPPKKPKASSKQSDFQAQMDALNARLDKLKKVLAELVKQAQARSGAEPADTTKKTSDKPPKKLTAKQKADAAKRAKENAKKNANQTPSQQMKELQSKIKAIQAKIKKMKAEIAAKKKPSTHKTGSVGASGKTIPK